MKANFKYLMVLIPFFAASLIVPAQAALPKAVAPASAKAQNPTANVNDLEHHPPQSEDAGETDATAKKG